MIQKLILLDANRKDLLEKLAELEHEQWIAFSKHLMKVIQDSNSLRGLQENLFTKWNKQWTSYQKLSDEEKEKDREWARKVIDIILDKGESTSSEQTHDI